MDFKTKFERWKSDTIFNEEIRQEVSRLKNEKEIEDRFYKELEFGTGGLRGIIGAGSNRMNIYTVGKATEGLARYLFKKYKNNISIAIAYDSRNMSTEFAEHAAKVFAANGIKVNLFESLRPTPELSFAIRYLKCNAGIVLTASHNPKEYNGYKVYGSDGCQITDGDAKAIINEINNIDYSDVKLIEKDQAIYKEKINIIGENIDKEFINTLKNYTIRKELVKEKANELNIIYTPIHGTGLMPLKRILNELGYERLHIVKEQENPDGNFPTAPYPNPEDESVFEIALEKAKTIDPDLIFGTDPDADRIGVIAKDSNGEYKILTGNQIGSLLADYIAKSLKEMNSLPKNGAIIKTIVTTEMARGICEEYGLEIFDVLTGFKYIGEMIGKFEQNKLNEFVFGFEESYGCLYGTHARDKDAIVTGQMICEMALYYKEEGKTLYDAFIELSERFGYYKEKLISIELKGKEGQEKISRCISNLRNNPIKSFSDNNVKYINDYLKSECKNTINEKVESILLPKSNVLKYVFEDDSWFVVRPSGTEPKMKIYLGVKGNDEESAKNKLLELENNLINIVNSNL